MSSEQLQTLKAIENTINNHKNRYDNLHLEIFGSPDSMFYGLKAPGKLKCVSMIGEEYDISPDLIEMLQDILIKKYRVNMFNEYYKNYNCPIEYQFIDRSCWDDDIFYKVHTDECYRPQRMEGARTIKIRCKRKYKFHINTKHCIQWSGGVKLGDLDKTQYGWITGSSSTWQRLGMKYTKFQLCRKLKNGELRVWEFPLCPKRVLIDQCQRLTDKPIKKNYTKQDLYDHLIKYT